MFTGRKPQIVLENLNIRLIINLIKQGHQSLKARWIQLLGNFGKESQALLNHAVYRLLLEMIFQNVCIFSAFIYLFINFFFISYKRSKRVLAKLVTAHFANMPSMNWSSDFLLYARQCCRTQAIPSSRCPSPDHRLGSFVSIACVHNSQGVFPSHSAWVPQDGRNPGSKQASRQFSFFLNILFMGKRPHK